jgi:hypothetical protein
MSFFVPLMGLPVGDLSAAHALTREVPFVR